MPEIFREIRMKLRIMGNLEFLKKIIYFCESIIIDFAF